MSGPAEGRPQGLVLTPVSTGASCLFAPGSWGACGPSPVPCWSGFGSPDWDAIHPFATPEGWHGAVRPQLDGPNHQCDPEMGHGPCRARVELRPVGYSRPGARQRISLAWGSV